MTVLTGGDASRWDHDVTELLDRNESQRLDLVRARAEKWAGGLTALTGLLSVVLVVKGPADVRRITLPWRVTVGVLLAMALAALAYGTYRAYSAAYGAPGVLAQVDRQPLAGLAERLTTARRNAAAAASRQLRRAVLATLVAVGLLAGATGVTWFAPTSPDTGDKVCLLVTGASAGTATPRTPDATARITVVRCP